ncbi:cell division control protein 6 homolog [Ptychodera flava]|uniref:cell division control protein 6 homolog n=1 Tax=Ptychodera flava TaxID=63121 RepID=UPI00396A79BE
MSALQTTIRFQRRKTRSQSKKTSDLETSDNPMDKVSNSVDGDHRSKNRKRRQRKVREESPVSNTRSLSCSPRKIKKENIPVEDCPLRDCSVRLSPMNNRSPLKTPSKSIPVDDDIRNTPVRTKLMFSTTQETFPVKVSSPLKSAVEVRSPSPRKKDTLLSPARKLQSMSLTDKQTPLKLQRQEGECYVKIKKALHTSVPETLLCREKETKILTDFLRDHVGKQKPGSLYVSGAPGTGKTASIMQIIANNKSEMDSIKVIFINCMSVRNSHAIYSKLINQLNDKSSEKVHSKDSVKFLQKKFTSSGPQVLLILDEIDQLDSKNQDVLYTMFEWPSLPKSRLVLIGIANALDLTDRILPRLQARPKCKPKLLNFPPYTKDQLVTILQDRLEKTKSNGVAVVDPAAVQFCARKVAAVSGDVRKALDVCRRAVEIVESDVRSQMVLQPSSEPSLPPSPRKSTPKTPVPKKVSLLHISNVISEVYGSRMVSSNNNQQQTFPVQQKLLICTLLLMLKHSKAKEITLGKLHDVYCRICQSRQVGAVDQSEFLSLCGLIETRGIIGVKKSKETRQTKISLKLNEKEVEFALQDKVLMSSILQEGLPERR